MKFLDSGFRARVYGYWDLELEVYGYLNMGFMKIDKKLKDLL